MMSLATFKGAGAAAALAIAATCGTASAAYSPCGDNTYDEVIARMEMLVAGSSGTSVGSYGQSYEGRTLEYLSINPNPFAGKPAILVTGGIVGSQWQGVDLVMNLAADLINGYGINPQITSLLDNVEVILIPVVNPDGYEWTWGTPGDRLWVKDRFDNQGSPCVGVNLDRNWDPCWGGPGSSPEPCSNIYRGTAAFSQSETSALRGFALDHGNIAGLIDCRFGGDVFGATSYAGAIAYSYGDSSCGTATGCLDAQATAAASQWMGPADFVGTLDDYLTYQGLTPPYDKASGTMIDWFHGILGVPAFQFFLKDTPTMDRCVEYADNRDTLLALIDETISPSTQCCPSGSPTMKAFAIVGTGTGAPWEWAICSPTLAFPDVTAIYPGSTGTALDIASVFATSINDNVDCPSIVASAAPNLYPPGTAQLILDADNDFVLKVRPVGDPTWCTVTTFGACSFNPTIQEILLSGFDCNGNNTDDIIDILAGTSFDENTDGIPDECQAVNVQGLATSALGAAVLDLGTDGELIISNIGSSGQDGIRTYIGEAESLRMEIDELDADVLPMGTLVSLESTGRYGGVAGSSLGTLRAEIVEPGWFDLTPDASTLGASQFRLDLHDASGAIVHSETYDPQAIANVVRINRVRYVYPLSANNYGHSDITVCIGIPISDANAMSVRMPSGLMVQGWMLDITAIDIPQEVESVSTVALRAANIPSETLTVWSRQLGQFGNGHEGRGDARLTGQDGHIIISSIGASGLDGVVLHNGQRAPATVTVRWNEVDPDGTAPEGAFMRFSTRGRVGTANDQPVGTLTVTKVTGDAVELMPDYSDIGSTTQRVEVYNAGSLMTVLSGYTGPVGAMGIPIDFDACRDPFIFVNPNNVIRTGCNCMHWHSSQAFTFSEGGVSGTVMGDEIRILAENPAEEVLEVRSLRMLAADIDTITITEETTTVVCPADVTYDFEVDVSDLIAVISSWGPCPGCPADTNGDQVVDVLDLVAVITSWGPCH